MQKEKQYNSRLIGWRGGFPFKVLLCLGLLLFFLAQLPAPACADGDRSYYFPRVLIEAEVHPDGSMTVVEERTFSFKGRYRGAWQYIYLKVNASIKDVQVSEQGEAYRQEAPGTQDIPGIFYVEERPDRIYIDWSFEAFNEERTFTISYTVENAVLVHQDVAELNYQFIGGESEVRTDRARVVLTLPEGAAAEGLRAWGHGPLHGEVSIEGPNRVVWDIEGLPPRTFLEGRVAFPKQLVPQCTNLSGKEGLPGILAQEEEWADRANRQRLLDRVNVWAGFGILAAAIVFYLLLRRKALNHPQAFRGDYYRELPGDYSPAEAGYFFRMGRTAPEDITATMLDLARRGHLRLEEYQEEKGLVFKRSHTDYRAYPEEGRDQLAPHESALYNFIFKEVARQGGEGVAFSEIEGYAKRSRVSTAIFYKRWGDEIKALVEKLGLFGPTIWSGIIISLALIVVGFILIMKEFMAITGFVIIFTGFLLLILMAMLKNLTPTGADHYAKWKAFKRFLLHFSELDRSTIPALEIWEHYLVYAVALGVAKQVMKQLEVVYPQLKDKSYLAGTAWHRMGLLSAAGGFNDLTSVMQQSFRSAFSSTSSGSGKGGGFSGGGGGGGGGGVGAR